VCAEMSTGLVNYDAMCHAISVCERVDELKDIRDKALALEKYMAQAENFEAERLAINVRLRAERRCGELLRDMKASGERDAGGRGPIVESKRSTQLSDLNITRDQSSRFQQLAAVPQAEFDAALASPDKPSTAGIVRRARDADPPQIDKDALWIWGRCRDFERAEIIKRDPKELIEDMTPAMRADMARLVPAISAWWAALEGNCG